MKITYFILLLLAGYNSPAQTYRLHGTVLNDKKQPISSAGFKLSNLFDRGSMRTTDSNGHYSFFFEPGQTYMLYFYHPGYTTYIFRWRAEEHDQELNVVMHSGSDTLSGGFIDLWKNPLAPHPPFTWHDWKAPLPGTHKGLIVDKHGRPITDAYVYAYKDTSLLQYIETDTSGSFVLNEMVHAGAMCAPNYLSIIRKGYKPVIQMDISGWRTERNFTLRRKWWQSKK